MDGGATAAEEGTPPLEASSLPRLRAELAAMKKRAVFKRAEELGVPESDLEEADEAADPKAAAIALILAHARLRAELAAMKKRAVFKRAEELGVPEADLEEADEAADPKAAAIALILELPSAPEPEPEELAAAEVRREKHSLGDVASSPAAVDVAGAASWTVSPPPSTQMADFASAVCIFDSSLRFASGQNGAEADMPLLESPGGFQQPRVRLGSHSTLKFPEVLPVVTMVVQ